MDLILKGGTVVFPWGMEQTDIGVKNGRIVQIGNLSSETAEKVISVSGLHVLSGVIDSQVHMREPGLEHKEDLYTGSRAAVKGGVTAVFEMPNTSPSTTTIEALADKFNRAKRMYCDHAFYMGASTDTLDQLALAENTVGCAGVKIFMGSSTGSLLVSDDDALRQILAVTRRRVAIHAEDEQRLIERKHIANEGANPLFHPVWRDEETALKATRRIVGIAKELGRKIHVLHISTKDEMDFLKDHKDVASVEVLANHLSLSSPECYERLGTYAQMNPPIRDKSHQEGLWKAVQSGLVDVLATDHAPHTREEKDKPYPASPSGMTGVQTLVPLMLNHVHEGRLSLMRLCDLWSGGPARIFGLRNKGRIAVGYDADFTIVDLKASRTIENAWIESRCGWTPFDGMKVTGWPVGTIIRGHQVMWDDTILGDAIGQPVLF